MRKKAERESLSNSPRRNKQIIIQDNRTGELKNFSVPVSPKQ